MSVDGDEPTSETDTSQLKFFFLDGKQGYAVEAHETARGFGPEPGARVVDSNELMQENAGGKPSEAAMTGQCREWLLELNLPGAAKLVKVEWNSKLRSTAGYASFPAWRIELNPRLNEFPGQVERTLKHELAHLIAYHRAGRRRIEPHGAEWREACACLGIPDERACHQLPLPRARQKRPLTYSCPACGFVLHRVRRFRRPTACLNCCTKHNSRQFDARFCFVLMKGEGTKTSQ